jgi:hypothetical protein
MEADGRILRLEVLRDVPAVIRSALLAALIAVCATAAGAQSAVEKTNRDPMVIFIAEGPPNSCGPGCNRWIAAEGSFDQKSAQRVVEFLDRHRELRLPIYFHSEGGFVNNAIEIAQHLRRLRMRAGIARTAIQQCAGTATSQDCRRLIEKTPNLASQLRLNEGLCASACVYAFVGASSRDVSAGARIGVHANTLTRHTNKGLMAISPAQLTSTESWHRELHAQRAWQHVIQMGVDPNLVVLAQKIDPRNIRLLSQDELVRLGIVTRDRFESPWIGREEAPNSAYGVAKTFSARSSEGDGIHLTTTLGVNCYRGNRATVFIEREMAIDETGNEPVILVLGDEKVVWVSTKRMNANYLVDYRSQAMTLDEVLKVVPKRSFELKVEYKSPEWAHRSETIKLSIAGLEKELLAMKKRCENFK